jgi:hypothetical protein
MRVPFTKNDDEALKGYIQNRMSAAQIARAMQRPLNSIKGRARKFGLVIPNFEPIQDGELPRMKELFDAGHTYSQIAAELGRTRNAILGKIRRLGWVRSTNLMPTAGRPRSHARKGPKPIVRTKDFDLPLREPTVAGVTLLSATAGQCRFDCGPHETEVMIVCGGATGSRRASFCDRHREQTVDHANTTRLRIPA